MRAASLVAVSLLAAACAARLPAQGRGAARAPLGAHLQIEIELTQDRFLAKESMVATVRIRNDGSVPLDLPDPAVNINWQPVYTVKGPAYPEGYSFHFRAAALGDKRPVPEGVTARTFSLAPGQSHTSRLPMEQLVPLTQAGEYTLTAKLDWAGVSAESKPVKFHIGPPVFRSFQIAVADGLQETFPIRVYCLVGERPNPQLYMAAFRESRPDLGEMALASLARLGAADPRSDAVFGAWINYTGMGTPPPGAGWQAGAVLGTRAATLDNAPKITLPETPRLVRPALGTVAGELDLFALSNRGTKLELIRFPANNGTPAVASTESLPAPAVAGRAAIGPEGNGSKRFVVLVTGGKDAAGLTLAATGALRSVPLTNAGVLENSEPAIYEASDGAVHTAVVLTSSGEGHRIVVADVTWPPSGNPTVEIGKPILLPSPVRYAAAAYSVALGGRRREWAALLEDGRLVSSKSPATPRSLTGSPVVPLQLLPMSAQTYLLTLNEGLPRFELLH
jgi:hypothetical protein